MAKTRPSGSSPASDIDFSTDIIKGTLIPNKKCMLEAQSGPYWTMYGAGTGWKWPEMVKNWPPG